MTEGYYKYRNKAGGKAKEQWRKIVPPGWFQINEPYNGARVYKYAGVLFMDDGMVEEETTDVCFGVAQRENSCRGKITLVI